MPTGINEGAAREEGRDHRASPPDAWELAEGDEIAPGRTAVRLLGGGERYETYLAWDDRLFTLVVAKLLRPSLVEDEHSNHGLATEAHYLHELDHPVIVRGFGADLARPYPHVVLEHLEGPRLSSLIRRQGRLDIDQLLPLGLQLSSALHYLRGCDLVHMDVKPSNIIMDASAKLIDLSIIRTLEELEGVTYPVGTDPYMAPEQSDPVGRGPARAAADVWGLGATLYHAAAGRRPFREGERRGSLAERFPQLEEAPAPLGGEIPSELSSLIIACLDQDPESRPEPAELGRRFEELVAEMPTRPVLSRFRIRPRRRSPLGVDFT